MAVNEPYDVEGSTLERTVSHGRHVVAVIGIDRYHHWQRLTNAVRDATGASELFRRLGFEEIIEPLLDDHATGKAIQSLVTDDLMTLGPDDSLVLFYAGHGGTRTHRLGDKLIKAGYLIPVDASTSPGKVSTWVDLEGWLRAVSLVPARHVLVVLDACHSGIALDPIIKWRDVGSGQDVPLSTLRARRSRRIITSALDDQIALDSGPVDGHSLFTGCLIEGLTHGIGRGRSRVITGSELGLYVQRRVAAYPNSRQTPDFGTFAFDDRGEMVISLAVEHMVDPPEQPAAMEVRAWLDLIDLDDKPDVAPENATQPGDVESDGTVAGDGGPRVVVEPTSHAGPQDEPDPAVAATTTARSSSSSPSTAAPQSAVGAPSSSPRQPGTPDDTASIKHIIWTVVVIFVIMLIARLRFDL